MEYLLQYEYSISYIKGEDNMVADALLRLPETVTIPTSVNAVFDIESNPRLFVRIRKGYLKDTWCTGILQDLKQKVMDTKLGFIFKNGLLFVGEHLVIPKYKDIWEQLFCLAHDHLGHFGGDKSYVMLKNDFYWPNMRRDLISVYIPGCGPCQ